MRTIAWAAGVHGALIVASLMLSSGIQTTWAEGEINPITVIARDYSFEPPEITLAAGETPFRLINEGVRRHNLVVFRHTDGVEIPSDLIRSGEQTDWSLSFDRPGRYQFWCNEYSHLDRGMVGYITVE